MFVIFRLQCLNYNHTYIFFISNEGYLILRQKFTVIIHSTHSHARVTLSISKTIKKINHMARKRSISFKTPLGDPHILLMAYITHMLMYEIHVQHLGIMFNEDVSPISGFFTPIQRLYTRDNERRESSTLFLPKHSRRD